jgi:glycosyltransferase involved in cell wall biosynthesis
MGQLSAPACGGKLSEQRRPTRVLHFVTGGFSGATQIAVHLCRPGLHTQDMQSLLVLRRKRTTDPARVEQLRAQGLDVALVPGWSHAVTILALVRLARRWQPDVLVAHGFPEHLLGRWAGWWAKVGRLIHVEHNTRERYGPWQRLQTRWLARVSHAMVGVSADVRESLLALGCPPQRTVAIPNGIATEPFEAAMSRSLAQRVPGIVMPARFARQKDHLTLLRAVAMLRERGHRPPVLLAGGGPQRHRRRAQRLCRELALDDQVQFLGHVSNLPEVLMTHRIAVLVSRYEGMPLALVEAMAAGCAVVGSAVPGVRGLIRDGIDGLLVAPANPAALADAFERLLTDTDFATSLAAAARQRALDEFSRPTMLQRYAELLRACPQTLAA